LRKKLYLLNIFIFLLWIFLSLSVKAETQTIQFKPGWNMFSVPVNTSLNVNDIKTQCGTTNPIWHYNPSSSLYESATQVQPGYGYWLKVSNNCYIQVSGNNIESLPELKAGWNQVGALSQSVNFNDVKGNCNVLGGPWKYNPVLGQYDYSTLLEPGYGYWIKVESDCRLIKKCPDGTLSGICSSTKPKYCDNGNLVDRCNICNCPTGYQCQSDYSCGLMPVCSDGTSYEQCSSTKPKYCSSGTLINKCSQCLCSSGTCQPDGTCGTVNAWLHVDGKYIKDEAGNTIILHGVNHENYAFNNFAQQFANRQYLELTEADYQKMAGYGFNVIRLGLAWQNIETTEGSYDTSYFTDYIDKNIAWAKKYGIHVVLSFMQWFWSPYFDNLQAGAHGFPSWLFNGYPQTEEGRTQSQQDFWLGKGPNGTVTTPSNPSMQNRMIAAWKYVATRYKNEPTILGYDLFNEPSGGGLGTDTAMDSYLLPFYERLVDEIKTVDSNHIFIYEPIGGQWSLAPRVLNRPNVIFSAHIYVQHNDLTKATNCWSYAPLRCGYTNDITVLRDQINGYLDMPAANPSRNWNIPIYLGEFGPSEKPGYFYRYEWLRDLIYVLHENSINSWSDYSYCRLGPSASTGCEFSIFNPDGTEITQYINMLDNPYPKVSSVPPLKFSFNVTTKHFKVVFDGVGSVKTEIYVPYRYYPTFTVNSNSSSCSQSWNETSRVLTESATLNGPTEITIDPAYAPPQKCSDGTPYGSCNNSNRPKYCSSGTLIDKCSTCGCASGQDCNTTSQSCYSGVNRNYILNYLNESFYRYLGSDVFALTWVVDSYDILGVSPPDRNSVIKFFDSRQNQTDGTWFSRTNHYVPITAQVLMLYNRSGVKPAKSLDTFFSRIDTWDKVKTEVQTYDAGNYWGGIWGYVQTYVVYKGQAPPWTNEFLNEVNTKFDSWAYDSHQRTHLAMNLYALNLPMPRVDEVVLATLNDQGPDGNWSWSGSKWNLRETVFNIFMLGMIRDQTTVDKSLIDSAIARGTEYVKSCYNTTDVNGKTSGFFYPYLGSTYADPAATSLGTLTFLNPQSDIWTRWIVPSQKTTCTSCGSWTNVSCGGSCASNQKQQTRTCTPVGCTPTDGLGLSRCVADSSCIVTGYDFAVIGDETKVPELENIYKMFNSLGITYKKLLPSEVVSGSLNNVSGAVSFVDNTEILTDASIVNLFSQNHLVISHGYDFANFYYPSIKNYRSKIAVPTITYLSNAREFQTNDKTEFKRQDGTLEIFSNAGLNIIPNTVKIAQYNSTHTAIFQSKGLNDMSGFYVMDLKATRNQSNLNGIWNVFPAVELVKSIPIGKYSSWIANGTSWPDLTWVNNHIKALATSNSDIAKVSSIGKTVLGRDINAIFIGKGSRHAIIDGCIHGNEKSGAFSAIRTAELLIEYYRSDPSWQKKLNQYNITIIPVLNPDGFAANNRTNANGKDLNRQFPPDGTTTEPETLALRNLFDKDKPIIYINHHEGGCQYPFTALYGNYLVEPYTNFTLYAIREANKSFTSLGHWGYINCSSEGKGNVKVNTFYAIGRGGINSMAIAYASKYINTSSEILETFASGAKNSLWALEAYPNLDINHLEHYDNDGNFLFYSNGFISSTNMQGTALDVTLDTDELTTSSTTRIRDMKNRGKPTEVYLDGVKKSEGSGWSYSSATLITTVTGAKDSIRLVWIT